MLYVAKNLPSVVESIVFAACCCAKLTATTWSQNEGHHPAAAHTLPMFMVYRLVNHGTTNLNGKPFLRRFFSFRADVQFHWLVARSRDCQMPHFLRYKFPSRPVEPVSTPELDVPVTINIKRIV